MWLWSLSTFQERVHKSLTASLALQGNTIQLERGMSSWIWTTIMAEKEDCRSAPEAGQPTYCRMVMTRVLMGFPAERAVTWNLCWMATCLNKRKQYPLQILGWIIGTWFYTLKWVLSAIYKSMVLLYFTGRLVQGKLIVSCDNYLMFLWNLEPTHWPLEEVLVGEQ